jgi:CheY-like chemotaxis protein
MRESAPIVLAEDDPDDVTMTLRELSRHQLANEVIVVRDGAETLDYLHRRGSYSNREERNPALVLLNFSMPKVGGVEVLRQMKSNPGLKNIPVLMLVSSLQEPELKQSHELGVNACVLKPVVFQDFAEMTATAGCGWLFLGESPNIPHGDFTG